MGLLAGQPELRSFRHPRHTVWAISNARAGRICGRKDAKRRFVRDDLGAWLRERRVTLICGGLDESPMAHRRLNEVLSYHDDSIRIQHVLQPYTVVMAGAGEIDPFKDRGRSA